MAFVPDALILDYVFQPICNRLSHLTNGLRLAKFFVEGGIVATAFNLILPWSLHQIAARSMLSVAIVLVLLIIRDLFTRIENSLKPDAASPARVMLIIPRTVFALLLLIYPHASWGTVSVEALLFIAFSFASCDITTPKPWSISDLH